MKKSLSIALVSVLALAATSASAMMMDDKMMSGDNMMMKTTMSSEMSMQMRPMTASQKTVASLAVDYGYVWKRDRMKLAQMAGVMNYRGTLGQNLKIKKFLLSLRSDAVMVGGQLMVRSQDIVDNAVRANNVTTVVAAVAAAGLVDTLKSEGPFTVFAPNNAAFAALPAGTVETLLKPENKATLVKILTYHVVSGRYKSSDLTDGLELTTVQGQKLMFTRDASGMLMINGSVMVETADVTSSNGVTHVIKGVLLPQ